ncbi:MAG: glycosyltransferase family 4 protein [Thermacetogeniaceae bacterium]
MRIGIFTDSYKPYVSGVVQSIDTFTRELRRRGHYIKIFAPRYPNYDENDEPGVYRYPSFHTPFYPEFYIGMPITWGSRRFARDLQLDLIHVHSPFCLGQVGASIARRLGIPLVFTYHTLYDQYVHYFPFAKGLAQKAVVFMAREFCNRCDLVVAPTKVIERLLRSYGVTVPIVSVATGINLQLFESGDRSFLRRRFGIAPEEKILLYVGRLSKEKNLDSLFRIFNGVLRHNPAVTLALSGSGPEDEELHELAEQLGIRSKLIFTGRLSQEEVAGAYKSADLFVFPSMTETQGLVLVEAMAAGLAVVARAAFGSVAIVDEGVTGYLCDTEEAFVERIDQLLHDQALRQRIGSAAAVRAQNLTAEKMAIRLERAYQALLDKDQPALERLAREEI